MLMIEKTGLPHNVDTKEHLNGTHIPIIGHVGITIDDAYHDLQIRRNKPIKSYVEFNGKILISEMTLDECYQAVVGKTKAEFEQSKLLAKNKYQEDVNKEKQRILIKAVESSLIFDKQTVSQVNYDSFLHSLVDHYHSSFYHLKEYEACLDIMLEMNEKLKMSNLTSYGEINKTVNQLLDKQNHSGHSYKIVQCLLSEFTYYYDN